MDAENHVLAKPFLHSRSTAPLKAPFKGEKWCRSTDFTLNKAAEPDHHRRANPSRQQFCKTIAQNKHQRKTIQDLDASSRPIPTACPQKEVDSRLQRDNNVSDRKTNEPHLNNWHIHPKTAIKKRVPPSIPVPPRPFSKEHKTACENDIGEEVYIDIDTFSTHYDDVISPVLSGSEVPLSDIPVPHISQSKRQDKNKINSEDKEVGTVNDIGKETLVSELHKRFSEAKEFNTKKPKVLEVRRNCPNKVFGFLNEKNNPTQKRKTPFLNILALQNKTQTEAEGTHERQNLSMSDSSEGESPEDIPPVNKYQHKEHVENHSEHSLKTAQKNQTMLPLPLKVYKQILSQSQMDPKHMCGNTKTKPLENLWQQRRIVRDSGILSRLSREQLNLQEHIYEVVTSEQSYLESLAVAVDHFQESPVLKDALAPKDRKSLFSSIAKIKGISQRFMDAVLLELDSKLFCDVVCDVVYQFALGPFGAYKDYIRNIPYQEQTLHNLSKESPQFVEMLQKLEEDPQCNRLPLRSFLALPFQRITRFKILMESVQKKAAPGSDCEISAGRALVEITRVVEVCNWEVGLMKQMEEMVHIANKIEFAIKALPLVSSSRSLVKRGELAKISSKENMFGQRKLYPVHLLLFNDLLLVAIRKGMDRLMVQDYAHRSLIEVTEGHELEDDLEGCELNRIFQVALLQNHRGAISQLLLQTTSEAEKDRWVELLGGRKDGEDVVYEEWDCPQVRCIEMYSGEQQGEISLQPGDIVNIIQKTTDGFLEGRRVHDGQRGWFSAACVVEITNEHVQRRHLRQRYHVLQTATRLLKQRNRSLEH